MSLLWRDKLYIALRPDLVEVIRRSAGLRHTAVIPCETPAGQPLWSAPLTAFRQYLQAVESKCDVTIILSNHFLRYVSVPWSDALVSDEERLALACIRFEHIYGDLSRHWSIRVSKAGYGRSCIASAVDQDLIDMLQSACIGNSIRLASIQPWLMFSINRYRRQLRGNDFSLLIAEPGQMCILRSHQNGDVEIKAQKIRTGLAEELNILLDREAAVTASGAQSRPYLVTAGFPPSAITPAIFRKFQVLTTTERDRAPADQSVADGMSMCGIFQ